jgi:hypothetical protein
MPEDNRIDDVEKFLADQKSFEDRAIKVFDEKLAKLGWHGPDGSGKPGKSHHKAPARPPAETPTKPKAADHHLFDGLQLVLSFIRWRVPGALRPALSQ